MRSFITTVLALSFTSLSGCAEAGPAAATPDRAEIEQIIKSYLLENPEIVREALIELEKKEQIAQEKENESLIKLMTKQIMNDSRDASLGPDDAKVTIVEFFDYNCGYCKISTQWVADVLKKHPNNVRVVFKELPILQSKTKTSRIAAKAALAADRQGKYKEMHFALMGERGLSNERIDQIAKDNGINVAKMRADMKDVKLEAHLTDTLDLAAKIPALTGTPFFIINDKYVPGASTQALQEMLDEALGS